MTLEGDWFEFAEKLARQADNGAATENRDRLLAEKDRATRAYIAGALGEIEWKRMVSRIDRELASLPPDEVSIIAAGERRTSMAEAWQFAEPKERHELCRILFAGIRMDVVSRDLALRPRPEFEAYFDARRSFMDSTKADGTPDRCRGPLQPTAGYTFESLGLAI